MSKETNSQKSADQQQQPELIEEVNVEDAPVESAMVEELVEPKELQPRTKTYKHLLKYPIAASWMRIHEHVPIPHILRPRLYRIAFQEPFKSYSEYLDNTIDGYLTTFETSYPQATTLRMRDIRDSITQPIVLNAQLARSVIRQRVTQPARKQISQMVKTIAPSLDVNKTLDPMIKPLNDRLQQFVIRIDDFNVELVETTHPKGYRNEARHTMCLLADGYHKGTPIILNRVKEAQQLPGKINGAVNDMYQDNKRKRGDGNLVILIASLDTARQLVGDGYSIATTNAVKLTNGITARFTGANVSKEGTDAAATPVEADIVQGAI